MNNTEYCRWCGMIHGTVCPIIKAIEYHSDGVTVKRVEFKTAADYPVAAPVYMPPPLPAYPSQPGPMWPPNWWPNNWGAQPSMANGPINLPQDMARA